MKTTNYINSASYRQGTRRDYVDATATVEKVAEALVLPALAIVGVIILWVTL